MDFERHGSEEGVVEIGPKDRVTIEKLYGPLVFMPIRVTLNIQTCEWIIERGDAGNQWREVVRIPGQLESDFPHDI